MLLQTAKSKHIPKRIKKFNKRRHKKEKKWIMKKLNSISKAMKNCFQGIERAKRDYFDRVPFCIQI